MDNTLEAVHLLENKLLCLLENYEFLKNENEILLQNVSKLQFQLLEKEQFIKTIKDEYQLLKIAKTIKGSSKEKRDAKLKINELIREIDKCIIQLQE